MSNKLQITTIDASATQIQEPQTGVDTYGADVSLTDATGNEVAFDIQYTVNKATSGEGRGVVINQIDTASPEGLNPIFDCQKDGTSQFYVRDDGIVWAGVQYVYGHTGFRVGSNGKITTSGLTTLPIQNHNFTSADVMIQLASGTLTNSSGTMVPVEIAPTYNQSSTAGATDLRINRTETAVGSGEQLFADYQIGGVSQLKFHTLGGIDFDGSGATTAAHVTSLNLNWTARVLHWAEETLLAQQGITRLLGGKIALLAWRRSRVFCGEIHVLQVRVLYLLLRLEKILQQQAQAQ